MPLQKYYRYFMKFSATFQYINLGLKDISSFHGLLDLVGLDHLIVEVPRSLSVAPHSDGLLWTGDRPVADIST